MQNVDYLLLRRHMYEWKCTKNHVVKKYDNENPQFLF